MMPDNIIKSYNYVVSRTEKEHAEFNRCVSQGVNNGFVIMPTSLYLEFLKLDSGKKQFMSVYKDYKFSLYKPLLNNCDYNRETFKKACLTENPLAMKCMGDCEPKRDNSSRLVKGIANLPCEGNKKIER